MALILQLQMEALTTPASSFDIRIIEYKSTT